MDKKKKILIIAAVAAVAVAGIAYALNRGGAETAGPAQNGTSTAPIAFELNTLNGAVEAVSAQARTVRLKSDGGGILVTLTKNAVVRTAAGATTTLASIGVGRIVTVKGEWNRDGSFDADEVKLDK